MTAVDSPEGTVPAAAPAAARIAGLLHPGRDDLALTEILCALADPNRLRVVAALAHEPPGACHPYPWFGLPVGKAGRTHHFRVLREAGLIQVQQHGNRAEVCLRADDVEARFPGLLTAVRAGAGPNPAVPADQADPTVPADPAVLADPAVQVDQADPAPPD